MDYEIVITFFTIIFIKKQIKYKSILTDRLFYVLGIIHYIVLSITQ